MWEFSVLNQSTLSFLLPTWGCVADPGAAFMCVLNLVYKRQKIPGDNKYQTILISLWVFRNLFRSN